MKRRIHQARVALGLRVIPSIRNLLTNAVAAFAAAAFVFSAAVGLNGSALKTCTRGQLICFGISMSDLALPNPVAGFSSISHADYLRNSRFAGLDGLRCLAIVAVVWHHAPSSLAYPILTRGFLGVDLFFVLSGFLITTLLLRERASTGRIDLKNFWMRRILRLAPAYYLLLFGITVAFLLFSSNEAAHQALIKGFPIYAFYLSNWIDPQAPTLGHIWSLATEQQFYLLWPIVEVALAPVWAIVWVVAFVLNQMVNFGITDSHTDAILGTSSLEFLDCTFTPILFGVAVAHLLHAPVSFGIVRAVAGFPFAAPVFAALILALLTYPMSDVSGWYRLLFHILATLLVVATLLAPRDVLTNFLSLRPIAYVGVISYGIYLYHFIALHAATVIARKLPVIGDTFVLTLLISIAIAAVSYHFWELPFLRLQRRFRTTKPGNADAPDGGRGP